MPFVLDASVTLVWAFDDEDHPIASNTLDRMSGDEALAPWLWWFEVRNALLMSERNGRGTEAKTALVLRYLASLRVSIDRDPGESSIYELSRRHDLTFYDAAYLELAQRKGIELATLDRKLRRAANTEGVALIGG